MFILVEVDSVEDVGVQEISRLAITSQNINISNGIGVREKQIQALGMIIDPVSNGFYVDKNEIDVDKIEERKKVLRQYSENGDYYELGEIIEDSDYVIIYGKTKDELIADGLVECGMCHLFSKQTARCFTCNYCLTSSCPTL